MRDRLKQAFRVASAAGALIALAGCQAQDSKTAADNASAQSSPSPAATANESIRAAAEPFEALTEKAFSDDWAAIDTLIADARTAVSKAALPSDGRGRLDRRLAAIGAARSAQDRVGLALAAVEGYRELVEAQDPAAARPPVAVSLLDYAGFRYDALAQAPNVDWAEMARTVEFARKQWQNVAPKVQSKAMPGVMTESLAAMASAVEHKDVAFARSAAATELALVDLLEEQTADKR